MSRTVFLHVGVAKTGTTYLQSRLARNRRRLRRAGVLYPGSEPAHFLAALDLREASFAGHSYPGARGAWQRTAREANRFADTTVVSHETLARCRPAAVRKAVESFSTSDVRVVLTARDLGRQIPSVWQENVKNRSTQPYGDYLQEVFAATRPDGRTREERLWRTQDLPRVARRWAAAVGPERVLVVTVPPPGIERDELWRRFATAVELPDLSYDVGLPTGNASLGPVQAELLRRLNALLPSGMDWPTYERQLKGEFVERLLAGSTPPRISVPQRWHARVEAVADRMIRGLDDLGVQVVGDLDDLRPNLTRASTMPDDVAAEELLDAALRVLAETTSTPVPDRLAPTVRRVVRRGAARLVARR